MKISAQQVQSVAELARLALSQAEAEKLSAQLSTLVDYFEQLDQLDTSSVEPTSHAVPLICPERDDEVRPSIDRERVLEQAPRSEAGHFMVPKVIG
jgi:aspartyl-tRNA(Asn)/glutamyl-tRNA(Gln) amidotransferase subunit C